MIDQMEISSWKAAMEGFVINDIRKAIEADQLETGLLILTFAGVDCLGGYLTGNKSDKKSFKKFVQEFFPQSYGGLVDDIYELRNKLVHDHIIYGRFITSRNADEADRHLQPCNFKGEKRIWFNRYTFAKDFLAAWDKYLEHIVSDQLMYDNLLKRVGRYGYAQVIPVECEE